jgi:hypothetical protein
VIELDWGSIVVDPSGSNGTPRALVHVERTIRRCCSSRVTRKPEDALDEIDGGRAREPLRQI